MAESISPLFLHFNSCLRPQYTVSSTSRFFIKVDIVYFKVIPIDCNILILAIDPVYQTFFSDEYSLQWFFDPIKRGREITGFGLIHCISLTRLTSGLRVILILVVVVSGVEFSNRNHIFSELSM